MSPILPIDKTNRKMYVLCTGGLGYIGTHTVLKLLEGGHKVAVMDSCANASPITLKRVAQIMSGKVTIDNINSEESEKISSEEEVKKLVKFYKLDLALEEERLREVFKQERFDAVIHFAGLKAVGESVSMPLEYYHNNLMSTINLLKVMKETNCKSLVFSSSATVYQPSNDPLDESKPLGASNPYGHTKSMIEQFLQDVYISDKSWSLSILRYFNPVGAHPSGLIGENPLGPPNNLMPFIQQVGVGKRAELTVFGNDYNTVDGTGVRDYIHVEDLAEGHIAALEYIMKGKNNSNSESDSGNKGGCYIHNLGSGRGYSVLEMVQAFEKASGVKIPYKVGPRRPGDLATVIADANKAFKDFDGWKTKRSLEDIMVSAWKWQSNNPEGYPKE